MISSALFVMRSSLVFYLSDFRFHGFYQISELFLAFSLRFNGYVFGLGIAVFIITDNDSSFPSTVLAKEYTSVFKTKQIYFIN